MITIEEILILCPDNDKEADQGSVNRNILYSANGLHAGPEQLDFSPNVVALGHRP
jgi:hypothetical protein